MAQMNQSEYRILDDRAAPDTEALLESPLKQTTKGDLFADGAEEQRRQREVEVEPGYTEAGRIEGVEVVGSTINSGSQPFPATDQPFTTNLEPRPNLDVLARMKNSKLRTRLPILVVAGLPPLRALGLLVITLLILMPQAVAAASWSPDGSKIAFSYIGGPENIYLMNSDGTGKIGLVVRDQRDFQPEWAPDGSHLVFTSVIDGQHVIMRVNIDGTGLQQITAVEDAAGDPDYSPDGTRLLYFTDEPRPRDLFIREVATNKVTQLTQTPDFEEASPRWAPDGRRIAFVGSDKTEGAESDIWLLDTGTGQRRNLTASQEVGEFHPDWSHDGTRVVYIRTLNSQFSVATRDVRSGVETIVASGNGFAVLSPHFSTDDSLITFTRTDFAEKAKGMPAIVHVSVADGSEVLVAKELYLSEKKE
jgi:Tol biopolymer transport system component